MTLNQQLEIPLIRLKDEKGREFETTNFEDESMRNYNLTLLNKIKPKMPFRIPDVLLKQQSYHLQKDRIISCTQNYSYSQLKGLKDYQLKQLDQLYQNDSIIINNYDKKGKFDKGLMKEQDLLMKIYLNSQNESINSNQTGKKESKSVNKIISDFIKEQRFMETDSKFDVQTNDLSIDQSLMNTNPYFKIEIESLYASSVYTQKKPQVQTIWNGWQWVNVVNNIDIMYPASNINNGQGYWLSTGVHKKTDIVSLQIDFDRIYKVQYILIVWAYAPGQFAVSTSTDKKTYTMDVEWQDGIRGSDWKVMAQQNQDYKQRYQSYVQHIHFEVPVQANSIRLLMRDNFFIYFGIYQLQIYQKRENIMFRGRGQGMHNQCLVIADGGHQHDQNGFDYVLMQDCLEAIQMMDARELFVIDINRQIRGFKNQLCIQVDKGDLRDNQIISMGDCNFNSDSRNLWIIDEKQRIKSVMNQEYCLTIQTGKEFNDLMLDPLVTASATSMSEDDNHPINTIIDGSTDTYWQSSLNSGKETITINLNMNRTAKRITIFWKYSPLEFQVLVMHAKGQWESIHTDKDHHEDITKTVIEFSSANIQAIIIRLLKPNPIHNQQSASVYAINNVVLENDNKAIRIKKCIDFDEIKANQFYQDEWGYEDQVQSNVMLNEKYQLQSETNVLEKYVEKDIQIEPLIQKCLVKAHELKSRMNAIQMQLDNLDIKITNFREKFDISYDQFILSIGKKKEEREKSTMIGSSSGYPAIDCKHVRENYVYKISGFYWVQGECQDNPIRVYCDFSLGKGQFYAFLGPLKDGDTLGIIKKVIDFRITCAKIGLQPVEIINAKQIMVIQQYIQNLGIKLFQSYIIAGVDYGCIIDNKCEGKYRSVSSDESKDITLELNQFIDKKNIKNMGFSNKPFNAIGFSQDQQLMAYAIIGKESIKGIICSDNSAFSTENMQIDLECHTSPKDQDQFQTIINTNIKVHCPKNCVKDPKGQVFGSIMYKSDSSICKAAIHAGVINNNKGGLCYLGIERGQNEYQGKEVNGITSLSYNQFWDQSFIVNKYIKSCPIDEYKSLISPISFIQINDTLQLAQYDEQVKKAILDQEFAELDNSNNNNNKEQQKQQQQQQQKIMTNEQEKEESMNTQQGIQKVLEMHKQELFSLKSYVKIATDANKLTNIINSAQISPLLHSDLSVNQLLEQLKGIEMHLQGTSGVEKELSQDANGRLKETWKQLQYHKVEKIKLTVWKQFIENYDLEVFMIFDILDNPKGTGVSKWEYTQSNLKGKDKALCQTSKIEYMNEDESFGSMVILIYQRFYDQKVIANLMMQGEGIVGVVFRAEDEFNFYVFEIKQNHYKRIRRVEAGQSKILEQINDGGYQQDMWYRVIITSKQGIIKVQIAEDTGDYSKDNDMPVILSAEDQLLTQGRAGFMTNNQNAFYVNGFQFIPLDCSKEQPRSSLKYKSPSASRYIETYSGKLKLRWKAYNHPNLIGTPVWIHSKNTRGRDNAISMIQKVHSTSNDQPPALYILSFEKYIKDGIFTATVNAYSDGFIGLVFRFKDKNNYYIIEIGGCKMKKQARVRKVMNGKFILLHQQEEVGYECDKWIKITVELFNDKMRFLIDEDTPIFNEDVMDDSFKEGEVGLLVYMTRADFDDIKLMPFSDRIKKQEDPGAPEEQNFEDVKVQGQAKDREKQIFINDNDKTPKWDQCLIYKTVEARKLHCNQLYDFDEHAYQHCVDNYCSVCCQKEVDDLHKVRQFQCQNQCEASLISDVEQIPYKICLDSAAPQRSVFSFCRQQFLDEGEAVQCQQGFCDLCCVTIQASHNLNLDDLTVINCHQDCSEKYEIMTQLRDKDGKLVDKSNIESVIKSIS